MRRLFQIQVQPFLLFEERNVIMEKTQLLSTTMALSLVALLGISGIAIAAGPMWGYSGMNMPPEQSTAMQQIQAEFSKTILPLQQQMSAKQAELDALYYNGTPQNDPKVQTLMKEISVLDTKHYAAQNEMRIKMNENGIPYGGSGMGRGRMMGMGSWHDNCGW